MSDLRRIIEMYIDVENCARKKQVGTTFYTPDQMTIYRGTQNVFRCHLLMSDGSTAYEPEVDATWLFGIDNVYTQEHSDLVLSENDQFNIAADWDDLSVTEGKICWRADLTGTALKAALGDTPSATMYAALWMQPSGEEYTLMAHWNVVLHNIAVDPTTAVPVDGISYATVDMLDAEVTQIKTPTGGIYRMRNGAMQLWNATQGKWHTIFVTGTAGAETLGFGAGED